MKERPILFSAPMVRALLDGSKTQTRRVVKGSEKWPTTAVKAVVLQTRGTSMAVDAQRQCYGPEIKCPYGMPGDGLWVRETWLQTNPFTEGGMHTYGYRATDAIEFPDAIWKPSIHMPRKASRVDLGVKSVRVERLQDINRGDAMAEGCSFPNMANGADPRKWYADLWSTINGAGSWDANPWVWVVEFQVVKQS